MTKRDQNSIQNYTRLVKFGKQVALVNLLLLCDDIALNPGPVTSKLVCPVCSKTIRKNQGRLNCVWCKVWHHLKCSLENSESARICRLCTVLSPSTPLDGSVNETFLEEALLGNVASEQCQVLSVVPQGSILGPLLFVLFVNDLPSVFSKCQANVRRRYTVIYYASQAVVEIEQIVTDELACLHQWLQNNNLFLNVKKTECLLFGTAPRLSKVNNFTIMAGNSVLHRVV